MTVKLISVEGCGYREDFYFVMLGDAPFFTRGEIDQALQDMGTGMMIHYLENAEAEKGHDELI